MKNDTQKPLFSIRIGEIPVPDAQLEIFRATFTAQVIDLLEDPVFRVMFQKPGDYQELMLFSGPERVEEIVAIGSRVCAYYN